MIIFLHKIIYIDKIATGADEVTIPITLESPRVAVQFSIVNDDVYERESRIRLSLALESPTNAPAVVEGGDASIVLQDDDSNFWFLVFMGRDSSYVWPSQQAIYLLGIAESLHQEV